MEILGERLGYCQDRQIDLKFKNRKWINIPFRKLTKTITPIVHQARPTGTI
jgi:hypothetical protein